MLNRSTQAPCPVSVQNPVGTWVLSSSLLLGDCQGFSRNSGRTLICPWPACGHPEGVSMIRGKAELQEPWCWGPPQQVSSEPLNMVPDMAWSFADVIKVEGVAIREQPGSPEWPQCNRTGPCKRDTGGAEGDGTLRQKSKQRDHKPRDMGSLRNWGSLQKEKAALPAGSCPRNRKRSVRCAQPLRLW